MESKCIYCGKDHSLSESDIIPDALTNARILNRNVCGIEHNNRFSDMFESKVIDALAFITNELDIKSSKGKKYASYDAVITVEGTDYNLKLHGDNEIFNGMGRLENYVQFQIKKAINIAKERGYVPKMMSDKKEFKEVFKEWSVYTYTKLLSEQIFFHLMQVITKRFCMLPTPWGEAFKTKIE